MRYRLARRILLPLLLATALVAEAPGPSSAAVALRHEYNEVVATIDTLVRVYSADRLKRLANAVETPGVDLPEGTRLVLLLWADDEARVYLNGAPVGQTRLTPTRIEIPQFYLQPDNTLTAQCWDTDRVESGFMAGLYLEDASGLRPIVTSTEDQGWEVASGPQAGQPVQSIFYAHTQPDLPSAEVIWGPQLFGSVDLQVRFSSAAVTQALRTTAVAAALPGLRDRSMDFHEAVARLAGLQERRQELATRLSAGAGQRDPQLRVQQDQQLPGLSYTLGRAGPLAEATDLDVEQAMTAWARKLPAARQQMVFHEARQLRGPGAATAAEPLLTDAAATAAAVAADRRADYQPPQDHGQPGQGQGQGASGDGRGYLVTTTVAPSTGFLWRMTIFIAVLCLWTGLHGWRGWRIWQGVHWNQEAERSA